MTRSSIEWTRSDTGAQGESWNPIRAERGTWFCVKVCPECEWCYSERMNTNRGGPDYVVGADAPRLDEIVLYQPRAWVKPRRVFVCSMTDLFQVQVPDAWIRGVFDVIDECPQHQWIILTKRPARMRELLSRWLANGWTPNGALIVGTSAGTQRSLEQWAPEVLALDGPFIRMLSAEPLLEGLRLAPYLHERPGLGFDWVVGGGESGGPPERALVERCACDGKGWIADHEFRGARISCQCVSFARGWLPTARGLAVARSLRDQCLAAGVPFFWKQWGGPTAKSAGRLLDGVTWDQFPMKLVFPMSGGAR